MSYFVDVRDWLVHQNGFTQSEYPSRVFRDVGEDWWSAVSFNSAKVFLNPKRRTKGLSPNFLIVHRDQEMLRSHLLGIDAQVGSGYERFFTTLMATGGQRPSWWGEPGSLKQMPVDDIKAELLDGIAFAEEHCDLEAHISWIHDEYANYLWDADAGWHRVAAYALSGWGEDAERFLNSSHTFLRVDDEKVSRLRAWVADHPEGYPEWNEAYTRLRTAGQVMGPGEEDLQVRRVAEIRKTRIEPELNVVGAHVYLDLTCDQELPLPDGSSVPAGSRFDVRVDVLTASGDEGWANLAAHVIPEYLRNPADHGPDGMYQYSDEQKVFLFGLRENVTYTGSVISGVDASGAPLPDDLGEVKIVAGEIWEARR